MRNGQDITGREQTQGEESLSLRHQQARAFTNAVRCEHKKMQTKWYAARLVRSEGSWVNR